jgi:putative Mg2+ transporter-C (MgtC) family protein
MMAGAGAWPFALVLTGLVVFINLGLRPLVKLLKIYTVAGVPMTRAYRVALTCQPGDEAAMRGLILRTLTIGGLHLSEITGETRDGAVEVTATVAGEVVTDQIMEQAVHRIAAEPGVMKLRWIPVDDA